MKLGTFVKQQAKELKTLAKEYFWKRWLQNQDIPQDMELQFDYVETMINNTMEDLERNLDREIEKKDFITETIINEMKEIFPNLDFLQSYDAFNIEDVIAAVHGLACTWAPPPVHSSSARYIDHCNKRVAYTNQLFTDHPPRFTKSNLEKVLNTKGVENVNVENAGRLGAKITKSILEKELPDLMKNILKKFQSLVFSLSPEIFYFQSFMLELQSGKNTQFEKLIMKILEEVETDEFMEKMDQVFASVCEIRMKILDYIFEEFLRPILFLSRVASKLSINENNKIDFNKFAGYLNDMDGGIDGQFKEYIEMSGLFRGLDAIAVGLKEGKYASMLIDYLLPVVLPKTSKKACRYDGQIIKGKAKELTAGAVQKFVEFLGSM